MTRLKARFTGKWSTHATALPLVDASADCGHGPEMDSGMVRYGIFLKVCPVMEERVLFMSVLSDNVLVNLYNLAFSLFLGRANKITTDPRDGATEDSEIMRKILKRSGE